MRVIVTRVQPQAARWVRMLTPPFDAVALPLIAVAALADNTAVVKAGKHWADYAAVMFVSSHAVDYFFEQNLALAQVGIAQQAIKTRAWSPGPSTRQALLKQGLPAHLLDSPPEHGGQFDSEALWQQVQTQIATGARVLIVRGDTQGSEEAVAPSTTGGTGVGRDWLAQRLQQAGVQVDYVVAYQRGAPIWGATELALATAAATDASVWLFSSAEALAHLKTLLPNQSWGQAKAVATHWRIADAALALGFGRVVVTRPTLADVVASIESMA